MDTHENKFVLMSYSDPGAFIRRHDDGTSQIAGSKSGNMYKHLRQADAERAKTMDVLKARVGEGTWNLSRREVCGDVPAMTEAETDQLKHG